jgi:hypothetical protein
MAKILPCARCPVFVPIVVDPTKDHVQCSACNSIYYKCFGCGEFGYTPTEYLRCDDCTTVRSVVHVDGTKAVMRCTREGCQSWCHYLTTEESVCEQCNNVLPLQPGQVRCDPSKVAAAAAAAAAAALVPPPPPPLTLPPQQQQQQQQQPPPFQFPPPSPLLQQSNSVDSMTQRQRKQRMAQLLREERKTVAENSGITPSSAPVRSNNKRKAAASALSPMQQPYPNPAAMASMAIPQQPSQQFDMAHWMQVAQMAQVQQLAQAAGINLPVAQQVAQMFPMPQPPVLPPSPSAAATTTTTTTTTRPRTFREMLDTLPADGDAASSSPNKSPDSSAGKQKRPNAYLLFFKMHREELIADLEKRQGFRFSDSDRAKHFGSFGGMLGKMWRRMSSAEKQPYKDLYRANEEGGAM